MGEHTKTLGNLIRDGADTLRGRSSTPRLDVELLLAHVLGWRRERLLAETQQPAEAETIMALEELLRRRADLEPVAYLTGHKEFYGHDLLVDRRVLVPRPETEQLVELALGWARRQGRHELAIADLGTGSGCIAIALALELPQARLYAVDRSPEALAVARANVERHALAGRVLLLEGDGLDVLPGPVDLLVSNPPYTVMAENDEGVRRHEPALALDGGPDGLDVYRWLLPAAARHVASGGAAMFEIGAGQGAAVAAMARAAFPQAQLQVHHDLAGHERVVTVLGVRHPLRGYPGARG